MEPLRDYLRKELCSDTRCIPLNSVITMCYRELLAHAHQADVANPASGSLQDKLHEIAARFVRKIRNSRVA